MRIWTLHPRYLDSRGLVALWREGLLAQKVLCGETRGYRHHPQLARFRATSDPVGAIAAYLLEVWHEAHGRGYHFDRSKVALPVPIRIPTTDGQIACEWLHLRTKLSTRDPARLERFGGVESPVPHPLFDVIPGGIEAWERSTGGVAHSERRDSTRSPGQ